MTTTNIDRLAEFQLRNTFPIVNMTTRRDP